MMSLDIFNVSSDGARIAVLCFGFLGLIVANTYIANLAAFLTVSHINSAINSVDVSRHVGLAGRHAGCPAAAASHAVAARPCM